MTGLVNHRGEPLAMATVKPPRPFRGGRTSRYLEAAQPSLTHAAWTRSWPLIDQVLYQDLEPMRARSREQCANNVYMQRWIQLSKKNVIGQSAIRLFSQATTRRGKPDDIARRRIETAWTEWSKAVNFSTSRKLSRWASELLYTATWQMDGEVLVQILRGPQARNRWGYATRFWDPERLDILKNDSRGAIEGDQVRMGVELDGDRPVAYFMLSRPRNTTFGIPSAAEGMPQWIRVPADNMLHGYARIRAEQTRGMPAAHSAALALRDVGKYREAAIVNARSGAMKTAFWKTPDGEAYSLADALLNPDDPAGPLMEDLTPGQQRAVPDSWELVDWSPEYPRSEFEAFNNHMLQGISSGLDLFASPLTNDYSGINLASMRGAMVDERDGWRMLQQHVIETLLEPIFPDWLWWQLVQGNLPYSVTDFDRLMPHRFQPRAWRSPEPLKDAQTFEIEYSHNATSISDYIEQTGRDPIETFERIRRERELFEELDIPIPGAAIAADDIAETPEEDDAEEAAEEAEEDDDEENSAG